MKIRLQNYNKKARNLLPPDIFLFAEAISRY